MFRVRSTGLGIREIFFQESYELVFSIFILLHTYASEGLVDEEENAQRIGSQSRR